MLNVSDIQYIFEDIQAFPRIEIAIKNFGAS